MLSQTLRGKFGETYLPLPRVVAPLTSRRTLAAHRAISPWGRIVRRDGLLDALLNKPPAGLRVAIGRDSATRKAREAREGELLIPEALFKYKS